MKSFTSNIEDLQRVRLGAPGDDDGFLPPGDDEHVIPLNDPPPGGGGGPGGEPGPPGEPGDDEGGGGGPGGEPGPPGEPGDDEGGGGGGGTPGGPGRGPGGKPGGRGGIPVIDIIPGGTDTSGIRELPGSNDKNEAPINREDLKDAIRQAEDQEATENKGSKGPAGKGKGGGRVAVTADFPTHTDWARLLINMLNKTKVGPPSWAKPHKRTFGSKMGGFPIMVPGKDIEKDIGKIIIAIDTSGSISDTLVGLFLSDLKKLFDTFKSSRNFRCKVIMWHTGPYAESREFTIKEFKELFDWVMKVFKSGGTAIDPVVRLINSLPNIKEYVGTIWFTDGQIDDLKTRLPENHNIFIINGFVSEYTKEFFDALKKYKSSKGYTLVRSGYSDE